MRRLQSTPEKLREELSKLLRRLEYGDVIQHVTEGRVLRVLFAGERARSIRGRGIDIFRKNLFLREDKANEKEG